jgi:RNA polymerase sigma-70 factor (ECF subfamily)
MPQNDEQILIDRLCNGDQSAFHDLVGLYKKKIYYIAYDITGDHHEAEDISQEVFMKVYRSLNTFRQDAKVSSWLYQIAVNTSIDSLRRKSSKPATPMREFDQVGALESEMPGVAHSFDPVKSTESAQIQHHISQALQNVSTKERTVFVMHHYNNLKLKEIAEILNITIGTVKSLLFRAIRKLRKELSPYMYDIGVEAANE